MLATCLGKVSQEISGDGWSDVLYKPDTFTATNELVQSTVGHRWNQISTLTRDPTQRSLIW